jgi:hypothetical protein
MLDHLTIVMTYMMYQHLDALEEGTIFSDNFHNST